MHQLGNSDHIGALPEKITVKDIIEDSIKGTEHKGEKETLEASVFHLLMGDCKPLFKAKAEDSTVKQKNSGEITASQQSGVDKSSKAAPKEKLHPGLKILNGIWLAGTALVNLPLIVLSAPIFLLASPLILHNEMKARKAEKMVDQKVKDHIEQSPPKQTPSLSQTPIKGDASIAKQLPLPPSGKAIRLQELSTSAMNSSVSVSKPLPKVPVRGSSIGVKLNGKARKEKIESLVGEYAENALHAAGGAARQVKLNHIREQLTELTKDDTESQGKVSKELKAADSLTHAFEKAGTKIETGETLDSFLGKQGLSKEDIRLESALFSKSETETKLKLAKRAAVMQKGGVNTSEFSPSIAKMSTEMRMQPSVLKAAYSIYKSQVLGAKEGKSQPKSMDGYNFHVMGNDILMEKDIGLAAGSFKLTREAKVLFQKEALVSQRPHTPEELKAFKLSKGETDVGGGGDEVEQLKEKFGAKWADDEISESDKLKTDGQPGDFKVVWKVRRQVPAILFLNNERQVISKPLTFDEIMMEDFSPEDFVSAALGLSKPGEGSESQGAAEASEIAPEEEMDYDVFLEKINEKYEGLDESNKATGDSDEEYAEQLRDKPPFSYIVKYQADDYEKNFQVEIYYVKGDGTIAKTQGKDFQGDVEYLTAVIVKGEDFIKEGFSIENHIKKMEGFEVQKFSASTIGKDTAEGAYTLSQMKDYIKDLSQPLDDIFKTSDKHIYEMDIGELEKLKESPEANEEIKTQLDKMIVLKNEIAVRDEFATKFNTARPELEKLDLDELLQYHREVDISFELSKLGKGIENITKVVAVTQGDKVIQTMVKPIAGQKLPGTYFKDGESRTIFDMEKFTEQKENLTKEGRLALLSALEVAIGGSVKMEENGWIHRDLKPENILLTTEGGALTDFGATVRDHGDMSIAAYGGTPTFSPPEAMGTRLDLSQDASYAANLTTKMDVWSWGMMFHMLLTDETHGIFMDFHPSDERDFAEQQCEHLFKKGFRSKEFQQKYETEYHTEPEDKNSLEHLCWECTHIDPNRRPSMGEVLEKFKAAKESFANK